jgi:hypothetical protein
MNSIKRLINILKKKSTSELIFKNRSKKLSEPAKAPSIILLMEALLLKIKDVPKRSKKSKPKFKKRTKSTYILIKVPPFTN